MAKVDGINRTNKRSKKKISTAVQAFATIILATVMSQGMIAIIHHNTEQQQEQQQIFGKEEYSDKIKFPVQHLRQASPSISTMERSCRCVDCNEDSYCGHIWKGGAPRSGQEVSPSSGKERVISVVLSHCNENLNWASDYLKELSAAKARVRNIVIYSKCNQTVVGLENLPPITEDDGNVRKEPMIIRERNVGRCDHTYAKWMLSHVQQNDDTTTSVGTKKDEADDIVLFLKDNVNRRQGKGRPLSELIDVSVKEGFACYYYPEKYKSFYHSTEVTLRYNMTSYVGRVTKRQQHKHKSTKNFKSPYKNMKQWIDDMAVRPSQPIMPVCYGGLFAVRQSQIEKYSSDTYMRIVESLSRDDNIEEGHFAERSWASLFRVPLQEPQIQFLQTYSNHTFVEVAKSGGGTLGALMTHNPRIK